MPFMPFKTRPNLYYVYDMNRNSIYKIRQHQYEALNHIKNGCNEDVDINVLKEFQSRGLLAESPIIQIEHPATQVLEYQLDRCVNSITFQMSQNCNLRCGYCPYSNNGIYDNRSHSALNINWDTLQQGIDFLVSHSKDVDHLHVAFYGGEPLIVKKLIIDTMKYMLQKVSGKEISFGMTTNGTLLDDSFAREVSDFNISIMISLDGPEVVHNKNRTFADGRGSYEAVYRNIRHIHENYPQLYKKLKFNTVISPNSNYQEIFDYFRKGEEIGDLSKVNFNTLSLNYTEAEFIYEDTYFEERNYEALKAYLLLLGKLKEEPVSYHKGDIETIFSYKEFISPISGTPKISHPSGTCVPGLKKLFVDVNGNFFPCERVDENSSLMKMGNVRDGFNIDKVREILNVGSVTEKDCKDCWAFHCCSICPASADNGKDEHYSESYKLSKCNRVKAVALENLKNYTMMKEFKYPFKREEIML
ncbi:hypothetical protein BVG16_29790 [Paenibacillus selenitireducens]|uniref:Radical SAM core domain-containing protein n=1 Tax=Paenibacillus selenitireducens TaxID=1324314 RepID=A0A1T2X131_9BACL|nr:radical SAM protein [Paenibacillus selenitireducens]OPA73273.1 hypothetical protein BVG16_29790 [Paenibacillus selenitireducens]